MSELSVQLYTVREALEPGLRWHAGKARGVRVHPGGAVRAPQFCRRTAQRTAQNGLTAPTAHVHLVGEDHDAICELAARARHPDDH